MVRIPRGRKRPDSSNPPPHAVMRITLRCLTRGRDMLSSIPYFRSNLVSDAAVTKELDYALADLDRAINRLARLRDSLRWNEEGR